MEDDLCRRVKLFAAVELNCAEIYSLLTELCPDKSKLWNYLSKVEQNHSAISLLANRYCSLGKLPESFMHPSVTEDSLNETLAETADLKKKLEDKDITCEEAIEKSIALEDAPCKVHFRDFINEGSDSDSEIISSLRELVWDAHEHVQILKDLVNKGKFF